MANTTVTHVPGLAALRRGRALILRFLVGARTRRRSISRDLTRAAAAAAVVSLASGCDTKGTCVIERGDEDASSASQCMINYRKRACDQPGAVFFEEEATAGFVRCKASGFESINAQTAREDTAKLKAGEAVILFRPRKPAQRPAEK
jgi:hypothetical protein